jgi:hypothetical protein
VLTVLGVLGVAGALVVDGGGGSGGSAAVLPADVTQESGVWSAATLTPMAATTGGAGPGTGLLGAAGAPTASTVAGGTGADDDLAGTVDDGTPVTASGSSSGSSAGPASGEESSSGTVGVPETDRRAGIATSRLVQRGTGRLLVVPGTAPAPSGAAPRQTVRVEVEEGIGADGTAFADFVMDTLNDPRSWGHGDTMSFARTDGAATFRVILASPDTSARLCAPAQTRGTLSCGGGDKAVITMYRWMNGVPDYGTDLTGYRHYVVNHEVGHVLGHAHAYCDPGHIAPVMVQQTKGLHGCLPNSWPFPGSGSGGQGA